MSHHKPLRHSRIPVRSGASTPKYHPHHPQPHSVHFPPIHHKHWTEHELTVFLTWRLLHCNISQSFTNIFSLPNFSSENSNRILCLLSAAAAFSCFDGVSCDFLSLCWRPQFLVLHFTAIYISHVSVLVHPANPLLGHFRLSTPIKGNKNKPRIGQYCFL